MIRYDYDPVSVNRQIGQIDRNWTNKAAARTEALLQLGCFQENSSIWSTVKPVFMELQKNKCVFCERQFESPEYGTIEFDLEHFRPKSSVVTWPDPKRHSQLHYGAPMGAAAPEGYYWLAYNLGNYAASCKVCNTVFKLNYFPVASSRGAAASDLSELALEKAYLCYPIGMADDDPEDLVTFIATTAVPTATTGAKALRGQVIIDFFGLNQRDILHRERARMIAILGGALKAMADGSATDTDRRIVSRMAEPLVPHAGCVRAFKRLWSTDEATARHAYDLCRQFGFSEPGAAPPRI